MDLRQTSEYADYMSRVGWELLILKNDIFVYKRSLGILGSIIKIQRFEWPIDLSEVEELAKKERALLVKLEPRVGIRNEELGIRKKLENHGFYADSWPLVPPSTRILDLSLSEEELFGQFSENCRRNIRKAQSLKLKIQSNRDEWFYENWKKAAKQIRFYVPGWDNFKSMRSAFGERMKIVNVVNAEGEWLAGVVLLNIKNQKSKIKNVNKVYYYYASASESGKKLRAPYLAAWEGMRWSKKLGCKLWDWEGVADERFKDTNTKAWKGFGEFKAKFGGEEVRYIGSFIKYYGWGKGLQLLEILNLC